jgi:hypothetical protein
VELPVFSGESPRAWLLECEDIFQLVNIPTDSRVRWGLSHIRGHAKTWLNTAGYNLQTLSWTTLSQILIDRFPDSVSLDPMDQLQQLKQITSINAYIDSYETWMTQMKRERTYLPHDFFVDRFVSGLKKGIKHNVQCQKPETLLSAYLYARQYEKAYLSNNTKKMTGPVTVQRNIPLQQPRPAANPPLPPAAARVRAPRKCWYCPENWTVGHMCQPTQRVLNHIEMQDHSDEEVEPVAPLRDPHLMAELPQRELVHENQQSVEPDQLMNISASAYHGCTSDSTVSLLLHLNKSTAVALADTGSTNTFMDYQYAVDHNIPLTQTKHRSVKVAGGGVLTSQAIAYNCPFRIDGHKFTADFRILELQCSDIILGVNWFKYITQ